MNAEDVEPKSKLPLDFKAAEVFDGNRGITFSHGEDWFSLSDKDVASLVAALSAYLRKSAK